MTTRYIIKCDDCKAVMGDTDDLRRSAAGGRCAPCRGFTVGARAWMKTPKKALWPSGWRPGRIVAVYQGHEIVGFQADTVRTNFREHVHWQFVSLEGPARRP